MSLSKYVQHRRDWASKVANGQLQCNNEMARKYGLLYDNPRCIEESYQDKIRDLIMDPRFTMESGQEKKELEDMMKKCGNCSTFLQKSELPLQRQFWKRQLSGTFFKGMPPPCPILTALNQQRYEVEFCFQCHCAKTAEDWIHYHIDGIKKLPLMFTATHTSNCVHNAIAQVCKQINSFDKYVEEIDAKEYLDAKLQNSHTKRSWLTTEGLQAYMLSEECTDTMIIQKTDTGDHYSSVMCQGDTMEFEENRTINREWLREVASRPDKLTRAASNLEKDVNHDVQHLVQGLIDLNTFILLATSDALEITRETTKDTLNSALPTEITTLVLCGFGFLGALEFAAALLDNRETILNAQYRPNRSLQLDRYDHRHYAKDDREIANSCVNEFDWFRRD